MPHPTDEPLGHPVHVEVLGPTRIDAPAPTGDRVRALTSMCVWLALHPDPAGCQIDRALVISAESRTSTLSRLRAWLGPDVVPLNRAAGRYQLRATTDWATVQQTVCDSSGRLRSTAGPTELTAALAPVRGEPLADIGAAWADAERLQMTMLIADIAHRLARHHLRRRQMAEATWALGRGLLAAPDDDRLRRLARLMRGNRIRSAA